MSSLLHLYARIFTWIKLSLSHIQTAASEKIRPFILSSRPQKIRKNYGSNDACRLLRRGCDSKSLFEKYKIGQESSFAEHLNQYDVILLDIQWMYGNALEEKKRNETVDVISFIQKQVIDELRKEYPECVQDTDISLPFVLANINI